MGREWRCYGSGNIVRLLVSMEVMMVVVVVKLEPFIIARIVLGQRLHMSLIVGALASGRRDGVVALGVIIVSHGMVL